MKCSTKSCPKKNPKRRNAAEQKPCTQVGPSVVTHCLFAVCLSNRAKLAGCYAAYNSSATKLYKPRYPGFGVLQEKPTCLHRQPARENPPRAANGCTFPANLGLELLGWILCAHPEAAVRSLCFILPHWRELSNWPGVVTRFVAEVCADILFNRDPFYCWAARAGSFPQHLHLTEVYGSLPPTPRMIIKHSLHTQLIFLLLGPRTCRANPSNRILLPCSSQTHAHRGVAASTETSWNLRLVLTISCSSCYFFLKHCCFWCRVVRATAKSHPIRISSRLAACYLQNRVRRAVPAAGRLLRHRGHRWDKSQGRVLAAAIGSGGSWQIWR